MQTSRDACSTLQTCLPVFAAVLRARGGGRSYMMRTAVKWALRSFGFEIVRSDRRITLADALEHIAKLSEEIGFSPQTVIDVGVADGTPELYRSFPKAKLLLIEPLKEFEDVLEAICAQYDAAYVIAAADRQRGTTTINITPDLHGSSILNPKESHLELKTREVPTVTIDSVVDDIGLKGPFVLKVDAQSSELRVLSGASRTLEMSEVIVLEVPLFQFAKDGPQLFDIVVFMKRNGFVVYDIVGHNYRPLDDALAEVDVVFVKENGMFRSSHLFASAEQRKQQFAEPDKRF